MDDFREYSLVGQRDNRVVAGERYNLKLGDVESFLVKYEQQVRQGAVH